MQIDISHVDFETGIKSGAIRILFIPKFIFPKELIYKNYLS